MKTVVKYSRGPFVEVKGPRSLLFLSSSSSLLSSYSFSLLSFFFFSHFLFLSPFLFFFFGNNFDSKLLGELTIHEKCGKAGTKLVRSMVGTTGRGGGKLEDCFERVEETGTRPGPSR